MVQREHDHAAGDAHRYHFRRKHPGLFLDGVDAGNRLSDVARGTQFRHATQIGSALTVIEPSPETTSPAELAGSQEPGGDSFAALAGSSRREPRAAAVSSTAREIRPSRSRSSTPSVVSAAVRAHRSSRIGAAVGMSHPAMSAPPATAASSSTVTTRCIEPEPTAGEDAPQFQFGKTEPGQVTKARRMDPDSDARNIHWEISVTPDGNGAVTIVLPATTDCDDSGAVCTSDGRMLSTRLELTVSGPGG